MHDADARAYQGDTGEYFLSPADQSAKARRGDLSLASCEESPDVAILGDLNDNAVSEFGMCDTLAGGQGGSRHEIRGVVKADPRRAVGVEVRLAVIVMDRVQDSANIGISTRPETSAYGNRLADVAARTLPFVLFGCTRHSDAATTIGHPQNEGGLILIAILKSNDQAAEILFEPPCCIVGVQRVQTAVGTSDDHGISIGGRQVFRPGERKGEQLAQ